MVDEIFPGVPADPDSLYIYKSRLPELSELVRQAPAAHILLFLLMARVGRNNATSGNARVLAELSGKSKATVERALKVLRDRGLVKCVRVGMERMVVVSPTLLWCPANPFGGAALWVYDTGVGEDDAFVSGVMTSA